MDKESLIKNIEKILKENDYLSGIDFGDFKNYNEDVLQSIFEFYKTIVDKYNQYSEEEKIKFLNTLKEASINNISILMSAITKKKISIIKEKEKKAQNDADNILIDL